MKLEVHVHSRYSKDSLLCLWPLYLKCKALKIEWIAITEHNNINGGVRFKSFCEKRTNKINVIVGEEIFSEQGEIIGLYLKEPIPAGLSAKETIAEIKRQGGVVYIPHPYDVKRNKTVLKEVAIAENRDLIDCIEVHNGRNVSSDYDIEQRKIAYRFGLCPVIGSDAHTWIEVGRNYMEIDEAPKTPELFKEAIKSARFQKKECLKVAHTLTKMVKLVKLLGRGNYNELYRVILKRIKKGQH